MQISLPEVNKVNGRFELLDSTKEIILDAIREQKDAAEKEAAEKLESMKLNVIIKSRGHGFNPFMKEIFDITEKHYPNLVKNQNE
jgi:hypothetical protein